MAHMAQMAWAALCVWHVAHWGGTREHINRQGRGPKEKKPIKQEVQVKEHITEWYIKIQAQGKEERVECRTRQGKRIRVAHEESVGLIYGTPAKKVGLPLCHIPVKSLQLL